MSEKRENKGVCCDVNCCVHNRRGCDCALEKIRVTTGSTEHMHFCGSFQPDATVGLAEEFFDTRNDDY